MQDAVNPSSEAPDKRKSGSEVSTLPLRGRGSREGARFLLCDQMIKSWRLPKKAELPEEYMKLPPT
jgi:hypothetical protein